MLLGAVPGAAFGDGDAKAASGAGSEPEMRLSEAAAKSARSFSSAPVRGLASAVACVPVPPAA